jgi:ankyrin repeat protein
MGELLEAIKAGDMARVVALLDAGTPADAAGDGVSPLLTAIYHGRADIAALLVARGATVSFPEACALGDRERVVAMLSGDPALLDQRSADGHTPVGLAIFFGHPEVARFLIERGADITAHSGNAQQVAPVHAAAAVCDRATMNLLLARGADVNAKQQSDYTPLHGAASRGDIEMATLLLAHGADREARGTDGLTPAGVAEKYGQQAFAEWLAAR